MTIEKNTSNQWELIKNQFTPIVLLSLVLMFVGCTEREVLRPTPQTDADPKFLVRVLLLDNVKACTLKALWPLEVLDARTQTTQAVFNLPQEPLNVRISDGKIDIAGQLFSNRQIIIASKRPHIFNLNGSYYRGKLTLILNPDGSSFDAINLVPLEPYLAGVIGVEMPDYWEPAALQAQAIAARTYCLYYKKRFGINRSWDVSKTQAHQVYRGVDAESNQIWNAVNSTWGRVLVCKHDEQTEQIFPAYYSSICGGHTENSTAMFGGDFFEPLIGVPCSYCRLVAKPNTFYWPTVQLDKVDIATKLFQRYPKLKLLGEITNITASRKSDYAEFSRLTFIKLLGSKGKSDFLRAEDFRLTLDPTGRKLKSTNCQIVNMGDKWAFVSGRGFGHGVGMCQSGAQAMARQGKSTMYILSHYYPNSKIIRLY